MTTDSLEAVWSFFFMIDDGTYLLCYEYPLSIKHMIMGFKQHLPLFIIFAGAIFMVQRKLWLNLQTVLMNHESSCPHRTFKKTTRNMMYFLKINNNGNNSIQLYNKNKRNAGIKHQLQCHPPANTKQMRMNRFAPSSKEQIHATPNHHHDTSTLQNNTKNAMKKSPRVLYTIFAGRKNRMLLQEPYWAEKH
jgi:hypothetical protein